MPIQLASFKALLKYAMVFECYQSLPFVMKPHFKILFLIFTFYHWRRQSKDNEFSLIKQLYNIKPVFFSHNSAERKEMDFFSKESDSHSSL